MWLFGAGRASDDDGRPEGQEEDEVQAMREEAEELRLKLEALEAAEHRDQLRACSAPANAAAPGDAGAAAEVGNATGSAPATPQRAGAATDGRSVAGAASTPETSAAEHYRMDDSSPEEQRELENVYDFSNFAAPRQVAMGAEPSAGEPSKLSPEEAAAAVRRLRLVEAKLQERETALSEQMEAQERKLVSASRALKRSRGQVQQLNAQLSLKNIEGSRLQCQVSQLRGLLVDKERRLQDALDRHAATESALAAARAAGASCSSRAPSEQADGCVIGDVAPEEDGGNVGGGAQQPQEPPVACVQPAADEEQLLQMSRIAEELTEALEVAREGEDEARRVLEETASRLQAERAARAQYERDLDAVRHERDRVVAELFARLQQREQEAAIERARAKEHEERVSRSVIEDRLQQALAQKGKSQFYPHLEV
mmetsp:Transcript_154820/g.475704  ORF Transcript_154820/g.475704 Transcript_154820/m.475704 type:complete len:427 (+) Transcript_154820:55-1335(+)